MIFCRANGCKRRKAKGLETKVHRVFQLSKIQQCRLMGSGRPSFAAPLPFNTPPHCYLKYIENLEICQRQGPCPYSNAEASPAGEHPAQHFTITASQSTNYCPLLQSEDYDSPFWVITSIFLHSDIQVPLFTHL